MPSGLKSKSKSGAMKHDVAVATYATERYVLGSMPPEEREEFEQHYFDCVVCAVDVQAAVDIAEALAASASASAAPAAGAAE